MKNTIILIAFLFLLKPIFPVLEYAVNYEYISKVLCENKDKPVLKCNGKCHLMKELAKASESEKPISSDKKDNSKQEVEWLFCQELLDYNVKTLFVLNTLNLNDYYQNLYRSHDGDSLFHPPIFIS